MKNCSMNVVKTMPIYIVTLIIFLLTACGESSDNPGSGNGGVTEYGTATLSWLPPTENTDGSILTNLAGYNIYYGTEADNYDEVITINNPGIAQYIVENLPSGTTYFFVITAFDADGNESQYSLSGSKYISA